MPIRWNPPRHFLFWRPVAFLAPSCCRDAGGKSTSNRRRTRCRSAVETLLETEPPPSPTAALFWTRAAGGVTAERREASAGLPSGGVETRAQLVARRCPPAAGRARAGVMASVEHYLTVLAGAQSAQNAEAQRAAAQMQIEVRLPRDRERQDAWSCARFVEARTRLATVPPPRRSAIPSFSHPLVPSGARIVSRPFAGFRVSPRRAGKLIGARARFLF